MFVPQHYLPQRCRLPCHEIRKWQRLFIYFSVTEVTSSAATKPSRQEKGTWPFGPSPATWPWPFSEREKPGIDFGIQSRHDQTYMFDSDGEGGPLYGTALMSSPAPIAYNNASDNSNFVHVLVDSGASDHYFDDFLTPKLNRRLLDYTCLTTPRKILTAGGALLDGTGEGILQGIIIDNYGNGHLVRIQILVVPTIGRNLFSVKAATRNGIVSIFDRGNPRLEAFGVTLPLLGEQDNLYSFVLDLSAEASGTTELAMNAVSNAQLWHRRLGHFNRRSLEPMQRHDGSGITFDGTIADYDVCAVRKDLQLAHPKKAEHAGITRPFQLCYGDLMDPFTPEAYGGFKYVSKITDQFTRWTGVYLLENKSCAFNSFCLFVTSTVIPCGGRVIRWRTDKRRKYTSEAFKLYSLETGTIQEFASTNTPQQNGLSERVGRTLCSMVRCLLVGSERPPKLWGEFMLTAAYLCNRMSNSGLDMETPFKRLYGKRPICRISKSLALEISPTSRMPRSWNPSPGNECCAALARTKRSSTGYGTRTVAGWWRASSHLIPQPARPSPLREVPPVELVDDYASTDDLLRDARDYNAILDFNVNIPAEHANADSVDGDPGMEPILEQIRDITRKDLLIPPGESSSGGASSVGTLPGGTLPESSSPSSAPDPMPTDDQAAPAPSPTLSPARSEEAARRTTRPAP